MKPLLRHAARAVFACVILGGCASDKQTDGPSKQPRGVRNSTSVEEVERPQQARARRPWDPFGDETEARPAAEQAKESEKDERDYGAELLAAVGSPVNCLRPRVGDDAPPELTVSLEVVVVETGVVTRGSARSAQLDDEESECVQARLATLRLRGPIPGAPRTVSATLSMKQQPPGTKPAAEKPEGEGEEDDKDEEEREPEPAAEPPDEPREEAPRDEVRDEPVPREDSPQQDTAEPQPPE